MATKSPESQARLLVWRQTQMIGCWTLSILMSWMSLGVHTWWVDLLPITQSSYPVFVLVGRGQVARLLTLSVSWTSKTFCEWIVNYREPSLCRLNRYVLGCVFHLLQLHVVFVLLLIEGLRTYTVYWFKLHFPRHFCHQPDILCNFRCFKRHIIPRALHKSVISTKCTLLKLNIYCLLYMYCSYFSWFSRHWILSFTLQGLN